MADYLYRRGKEKTIGVVCFPWRGGAAHEPRSLPRIEPEGLHMAEPRQHNHVSLCHRIQAWGTVLLLTGDADRTSLTTIHRDGLDLAAHILAVPHHAGFDQTLTGLPQLAGSASGTGAVACWGSIEIILDETGYAVSHQARHASFRSQHLPDGSCKARLAS